MASKKPVEFRGELIFFDDIIESKEYNPFKLTGSCVRNRMSKKGEDIEKALSYDQKRVTQSKKHPEIKEGDFIANNYAGVHPEIVKAAVATPFNLNHFLEVSEKYKDALPRDPYGKSAHAWKPKSRLKAKSKIAENAS